MKKKSTPTKVLIQTISEWQVTGLVDDNKREEIDNEVRQRNWISAEEAQQWIGSVTGYPPEKVTVKLKGSGTGSGYIDSHSGYKGYDRLAQSDAAGVVPNNRRERFILQALLDLNLTNQEIEAILNANNGSITTPGMEDGFILNITDWVKFYGGAEHKDLPAKISAGGPMALLALMEASEKFWRNVKQGQPNPLEAAFRPQGVSAA